jgi:hypothetical protein
MKTEGKPSSEGDWLDKANLRRVAFWTMVFWAIIWAMAPWLDRPVVQPIHNEWVLTGRGLASYPMWGYSLLIRLWGSVTPVVVLQSFLGALATAALMVRLNCLVPRSKGVTTTLFVLALPWLSYMAYAYQMPISSAFMVLALLLVETALRTGRIVGGIVAGVLCGFGQNFRSELLLLPGTVLLVVYLLNRLHWFRCPSIKPLAACVGVALMFQIPWALNCYFNAGRFSLSESNLGQVAFLGLGRLPSNPWNIEPSDGFAEETVTKAGLDCSWLSFEASDLLKRRFVEAVSQNPAAYVKCIGARIWKTVYYPFSFVSFAATPADKRAVREAVGMIKPWVARTAADDPEPGDHSASPVKVGCLLLYAISQGILIRAVSILGIIGLFLALGKAPFQLSQPVVLCLGVALAYRFGMNVAISDSGKYMTGVYLCYLPFAANTLWAISRRPCASNCGLDAGPNPGRSE